MPSDALEAAIVEALRQVTVDDWGTGLLLSIVRGRGGDPGRIADADLERTVQRVVDYAGLAVDVELGVPAEL